MKVVLDRFVDRHCGSPVALHILSASALFHLVDSQNERPLEITQGYRPDHVSDESKRDICRQVSVAPFDCNTVKIRADFAESDSISVFDFLLTGHFHVFDYSLRNLFLIGL